MEETMSELGFVGSDVDQVDSDDKARWDDLTSSGAGAAVAPPPAASSRSSSLLLQQHLGRNYPNEDSSATRGGGGGDGRARRKRPAAGVAPRSTEDGREDGPAADSRSFPPAATAGCRVDVPGEYTSTPDEKRPIEVACKTFSCNTPPEAANHFRNFNTEIQAACQTLKEPSYKAIYGSCNSGQMNSGKGNLLAKSGKQLKGSMVKALSAQPYHPVFPVSQGVSSRSSSSQHMVNSSPLHRALHGSKSPYQLTELSDPHDKFVTPSSFQGVNTGSIYNTLSEMNLPTNSTKENTVLNQLKLQKQIDGYQNFGFGSGLNRDDAGGLTVTGVRQKVQVGQNMVKALSAEPYQPVFPVSHGARASLSSSVASQLREHPEYHPKTHHTHRLLQPTIKARSTSMTPHVEEPYYQENSCLADSSFGVQQMDHGDNISPGISLLRHSAISTRDAECIPPTLGDRVHADVSEIYSTSGHQTAANRRQIQSASQFVRQSSQHPLHGDVAGTYSPFGHQYTANNIQRQFVPQVERQPSHRYLDESNYHNLLTGPDGNSQKELFRPTSSYRSSTDVTSGALPRINLQSGAMMVKADFNQKNLQRQIGLHENTASRAFSTYPDFPRTSSFPHQQSSEFPQLNSTARRCLPGSRSPSTRVGQQAEQSIMIGARPFNTISGGASPLPGSPVSSMSAGSPVFSPMYQPGGYNTNSTSPLRMAAHAREAYATFALPRATGRSHKQYLDSAELSSQLVQEMGLDETTHSNMWNGKLQIERQLERDLQRQLERKCQKVASETQALRNNAETSVWRDPIEEFLQLVRAHEACFLSFYHPSPVPAHVMNMLDRCFGVDMEREMSRPQSRPTPDSGSPRLDTSGFTHMHDSKRLENDLHALLLQGKFSSLNKGNHRLFHIEGHVFECSIDQCGSRFIQQKLPTATPEEIFIVFKEILPHVVELVTDVFGNYVVQKMIELGAPFQRREITACFLRSALSLSCQLYGCRVVQRAVEYGDLDQKILIAKELNNDIMKCIHDPNANHVVQKCIEHIPPQFIHFFLDGMYGHVVELSVHPYGCRVIQRILEYFDEPSIQDIFLEEVIDEVCYLSKDQYANYVVQHILQHGKARMRSAVIKRFAGRVMAMSKQSFLLMSLRSA
ncbi:hypothetical protein GUJ93_ZPchr0009g1021 [Zizania palustris]|uniref:PUM-HD domain-containing protein n=1 Tax=Zizania palustris TaxID=103762 RepID=A0A8J5VLN5_ZIZPA|nr:hypothetical protein GUJ93_ZPchr0009g1021 [Zizania palustris]